MKKRIGDAAYELELLEVIKIHPIISITQLEAALPGPNLFGRNLYPELGPEDIDDEGIPIYTIEKLLDRRITGVGIK